VPNPEDLINFVPPGQNAVPSSFQLAVKSNSRRVVKAFLELTKTPGDLLKPDSQGYLPLQLAVAYGHDKIVKLLLDK
jgi:ankyrin repeat protein